MANTFRTFVAIQLPEKLQATTSRLMKKFESCSEYRWVRPENLHLTLNFLGDVPQQDISSICRNLESTLQGYPAFQIQMEGVGAFPKPDRPRVIWLGVTEGTDPLVSMQKDCSQLLDSAGFDRDRNKFKPHVTIGRLRKDRRASDEAIENIQKHSTVLVGEFKAHEVIVFASFLEREGPTYTPLATIALS